jgi:hypothetical protein
VVTHVMIFGLLLRRPAAAADLPAPSHV